MMFNWPLFIKELREARWKWIIAGGSLLLTAVALPVLFPYMETLLRGVSLPQSLSSLIEPQVENYALYIWMNWYGKNLFQIALVLAAVLGASPITSEKARGSWEFLLSQPLSKKSVFFSKYFAGLSILILTTVIMTCSIVPLSRLADQSINLGWFIRGLPVSIAAAAMIYSISWLAGILLDDTLQAAVAGLACLAGMIASGWIPQLEPISLTRHLAALKTMRTGMVDLAAFAVLTLVSTLIVIVSYTIFMKQNV